MALTHEGHFLTIGVDYYPEQWPRERWAVDAELMAEAGIRLVRVGEFAWSLFEPTEGRFSFGWLDDALNVLMRKGIWAIIGTPTATPPAWLIQSHPEILPVDEDRVRLSFGSRRHYCPNSESYRDAVRRIVTALAEHYRDHPAVIGWQIDNEFACHRHMCFCDSCKRGFHEWLRRKYHSLEALNDAWGTVFWSQVYTDWSQIPVPARTVAVHNPSMRLDYRRFMSQAYVDFQSEQVRILRERCPHHRITTNFMGLFPEIDYFELARHLDFVAWDNYPDLFGALDPVKVSMAHDLTRSLKHRRFWVMEQQAGPTGWDGVLDPTPRPGQLRLWTWQAVARGAEAVVYFRWRTALKGAEQFWHGILDHDGQPKRRYSEIRATARELMSLPKWLGEARIKAPIGLLYSYPDLWAWQIQPHNRQLDFERRVVSWYRAFWQLGLGVEMVNAADDTERLDPYRVLVVPSILLVDEPLATRLHEWVRAGGVLMVGVRTGVKNSLNQMYPLPPPGPLADLLGVVVDEYDSLREGQTVGISLTLPGEEPLYGKASGWCEILKPRDASVIARYQDEYYRGQPAATVRRVGGGAALYVGSPWDQSLIWALADWALKHVGISGPISVESGANVEVSLWETPDGKAVVFVLNHEARPVTVRLNGGYTDALTGKEVPDPMLLDAYDVRVFLGVAAN